MRITYDIDLENFETWSGASATLEKIINEGKCEELETALEEMYPDGMDETQLNDILWFESDWCYEVCGIRTEEEIEEELEKLQDEMEELMENFLEECEEMIDFNNESRAEEGIEEMTEEEINSLKNEIWANNYADEAQKLQEEIDDLECELEDF